MGLISVGLGVRMLEKTSGSELLRLFDDSERFVLLIDFDDAAC